MNDVFFLLLVKEKYENAPEETFTVTVKYQGQKKRIFKGNIVVKMTDCREKAISELQKRKDKKIYSDQDRNKKHEALYSRSHCVQ